MLFNTLFNLNKKISVEAKSCIWKDFLPLNFREVDPETLVLNNFIQSFARSKQMRIRIENLSETQNSIAQFFENADLVSKERSDFINADGFICAHPLCILHLKKLKEIGMECLFDENGEFYDIDRIIKEYYELRKGSLSEEYNDAFLKILEQAS